MTIPSWLPDIYPMDGNWNQRLKGLFKIFEQDFVFSHPQFEGCTVYHDERILDGEYPEGFWHITTKGTQPNRLPDFRRAERLPWCKPSIQNSDDQIIKKWDYIEGQKGTRVYIWLETLDYVIILQPVTRETDMIYYLVTAFHVDGERSRNGLKRKYEEGLKHSSPVRR